MRDNAAYSNYFGAGYGANGLVLTASSDISQNGDDAIELYFNGTVVDLYGDLDVDGTGEAGVPILGLSGLVMQMKHLVPLPQHLTLHNGHLEVLTVRMTLKTMMLTMQKLTLGSSCPFPVDEVCPPPFMDVLILLLMDIILKQM